MRRFYALFSSLCSGVLVAAVLMFGLGFVTLDADKDTSNEGALEVATDEVFEVNVANASASDCTIGSGAITGFSPLVSNILIKSDCEEEEHTCTGSPCSHCEYQSGFGCECHDFDQDHFCNHSTTCVEDEEA